MFKPFFIHKNLTQRGYNAITRNLPWAFTAKVEPCKDNPREVLVAVAYCSQKDQFCKATGRSQAEQRTFERINIRHLPEYLAECEGKLWHGTVSNALWYLYVLKYVV
jgi:hypothetical protein